MIDDDPYVRDEATGAMMRRSTAEHRARERAEVAAVGFGGGATLAPGLPSRPAWLACCLDCRLARSGVGDPGAIICAGCGRALPVTHVTERAAEAAGVFAALRAGVVPADVLSGALADRDVPEDVAATLAGWAESERALREFASAAAPRNYSPGGDILPSFLGKVDEALWYVTTPVIGGEPAAKGEEDDDFDLFKSALVALRKGATPAAVLSDMLVERPDIPEDIYVILASWMKRERALPSEVCFGGSTYTLPEDAEDGAVRAFRHIGGRWYLIE